MTKSVLFVCLGNICRSPLAEGLFSLAVKKSSHAGKVHVDSAGTSNWHIGKLPHEKSQKVAIKRGIDISNQRCRQIHVDDFDKFDLILGMDHNNVANIKQIAPADIKAEIGLFLEYGGIANKAVPDPWGECDQAYEQVADMIEQASINILERLFDKTHA